MDTHTQESSGSSTRPRRQLLTSRQAQDLLSTLLDGEISVEEPSTISDEEFDGSSLSSRSRSNTSSSDKRPLIPAKRSKPSTTKGTNRPRSTATESVVTGGQTPSVLQKISHRLEKDPASVNNLYIDLDIFLFFSYLGGYDVNIDNF